MTFREINVPSRRALPADTGCHSEAAIGEPASRPADTDLFRPRRAKLSKPSTTLRPIVSPALGRDEDDERVHQVLLTTGLNFHTHGAIGRVLQFSA